MTPFDPDTNPVPDPITVEEAVDEGLMLAEYASRMTVKNRILMDGLTGHVPFAVDHYARAAADALESLASESVEAADRLHALAEEVTDIGGRSDHVHDYRSADIDNLEHREGLSRGVARSLRARAADREFLTTLVEKARSDAWRDLSQSIEEKLDRAPVVDPHDADYVRDRPTRMALVVVDDLARLAEERGVTLT